MKLSIKQYLETAERNFSAISETRIELLNKISDYVSNQIQNHQDANLVYICTHNSRRSHFGQIWAKVAAEYYGILNVNTYSGGTEATAFNTNAINALKRIGFEVLGNENAQNPHYEVFFSESAPIICFSKRFDDLANPQGNFCAVMTCSDADENCPFIPGASVRVATTYEDPKMFDGTAQQDAKYDERCLQIATEALYVFSKVKKYVP